jgi:hypothetical protein
MGSNQSSIQSQTPTSAVLSTREDPGLKEDTKEAQLKKKSRQPPKNLSGAALVEYKCRKKKKTWSKCVGSWYDDRFLPGKALEEEQADCDDLFERFRECYMKNMLNERLKKGLELPKEGTVLAEYMEEEGILLEKK